MTGRYKAYPEYKSTDEVWLGNVPSHWRDLKINRLTIVKRGASPRPIDDPKYFDEAGEYSWVRIADVTASDTYLENTPQRLSPLGASLSVKLEPNELFLSIAGTVGKPCINKIKVCIHDGFVYFPEYKENTKFLFYIFAAGEAYKGLGKFGTQLNLNTETVGGIKIGIPCIEEQHKIVNFLDHETAKIDSLIAKQEKLIELLKEKRQAVISHAVTKGLNPDAPMKDSGVEWLGEVPEHWIHSTLKHYSDVIDCKHITAEFFDDGIPLASIGEVKGWSVNLQTAKYTNEEYYTELIGGGRKPQVGDIIYSRNATVGEAAIVRDGLPPFAMGQDVCLIRLNQKLHPEFAMYILHSGLISQQLELAMVGSTFKRINVDNIRNFLLAIPPYQEQKAITEELERLTSKYDSLISNAESAIDLMKERKTALISAAVTGKIDVRHFVAEQGQPQGV